MCGILLSRVRPAEMMAAFTRCTAAFILSLASACVFAQEAPAPKADDLDVTMQIMVDPAATRPEEVIRKIPLPTRKPVSQPAKQTQSESEKKTSQSATGQDHASEGRQLGKDMAESARERAQEAADQREQARRSAAEEHRQNPPAPPGRPPRS
jgi:hypothetical protein